MRNPVDCRLPSFWSGKMYAAFQKTVCHLYERIKAEMGSNVHFRIEEHTQRVMEEHLDISAIDAGLSVFLRNPAPYIKKEMFTSTKFVLETYHTYWEKEEKTLLKQMADWNAL